MISKDPYIIEYGDFQTPNALAGKVCSVLSLNGVAPVSVLEPTCGTGSFLKAVLDAFPSVRRAVGIDINSDYVERARRQLRHTKHASVDLLQGDYFSVDWERLLESLADPLLIIGNPPWANNSTLASLGSSNLPEKDNFQSLSGIDAITGRSNFDISEWMIIQALEWINHREAVIAMLCKTAVARRVLSHIWETGFPTVDAKIYNIDAAKYFDVAVDACLLVLVCAGDRSDQTCRVYDSLDSENFQSMGFRDGRLIANLHAFERLGYLLGHGPKWRSGIKHDCVKLMELTPLSGQYVNGLGDIVCLEETYLYPMLKSSDIAKTATPTPSKVMLVPQSFVGEDTAPINRVAPLTWRYLQTNGELLDGRKSSIYRGKPRFSIFGIGNYSFSPWKVAVSGFYKAPRFRVIGPVDGRPVMLDDTCYFLPCSTRENAEQISAIMNSQLARDLLATLVFADAKRPVTAKLLESIDINAVADELGRSVPLFA